MIILDTLLVGGLKFVLGKIASAVDAELSDDSVWREELLAAQMRLELGEITEAEFAEREQELLARIREIRERAEGRAGAARGVQGHRGRGERPRRRRRARRGPRPPRARPVSRPGTRGRPPCYEFIGGKGGVGKTTTAAALALGAAGAGRRTLVVSTDPAHSLGDALGRRLGSRVTRIPGAGGVLDALELDADRALARWLRARRAPLRLIAERGTYLDETDVDRFLDLSFPGVDELGGLLELRRVAESGRYETVVVDTAPTGHTLRLLSVPEALQRIAAVLGEMLAKHHFLLTRLSGRDRLDAADGLVIEIDAEARGLSSLVRDPERCRFRWAVLPERLAVEEARDAVRTLARSGISIAEILVNRVTPPARAAGPFGRRRIAAERAAIAAVRKSFPNCPIRLVPELAAEPRGAEALRPLVRSLGRPARGRELLAGPPPRGAAGRRRPRSGSSAVTWARLLAPPDVRLLLFVGKGGVGKTTCAAAMALALGNAAPGRRVLLLSTDPAHSLGDVLATPVGDDERRVRGGPAALTVRELDADRAFALRRDHYRAAVDELFDAIRGDSRFDVAFDRAVAQDLLDLAPGGLDELCALLTVTEALFPAGGRSPSTRSGRRRHGTHRPHAAALGLARSRPRVGTGAPHDAPQVS